MNMVLVTDAGRLACIEHPADPGACAIVQQREALNLSTRAGIADAGQSPFVVELDVAPDPASAACMT